MTITEMSKVLQMKVTGWLVASHLILHIMFLLHRLLVNKAKQQNVLKQFFDDRRLQVFKSLTCPRALTCMVQPFSTA